MDILVGLIRVGIATYLVCLVIVMLGFAWAMRHMTKK
jgi:hypothetical protein